MTAAKELLHPELKKKKRTKEEILADKLARAARKEEKEKEKLEKKKKKEEEKARARDEVK